MANRFSLKKNSNPRREEIGAVWISTSEKGEQVYRIKININGKDTWFVAFPNKYKTAHNSPDLSVYEERPLK